MMATRKLFTLLMTICLFAVSGSALAGSRGDNDKNDAGDRSQGYKDTRKIDVMTANLYLGADIFRIVEAAADTGNPLAIPTAVTGVFGIVQATNFPERAEAIADSIMKRRPQVIGLQEVSWYRTGPYDGGVDATYTVYDFLEILMNALAARGLDYRVAGEVTNADVEAPMFVSAEGDLADLRLTDRDVILVRGDVQTGAPFAGNYSTNAGFALGDSFVYFTRGYVMVPVNVMGRSYLFVNSHLETRLESFLPMSVGRVFQFAQSAELAGTVAFLNTNVFGNLPVILVGDLNSDPNDQPVDVPDWAHGEPLYIPDDITVLYPPYQVFAGAGYTDTWTVRKGRRDSGETCCHDEALDNTHENFYERIDHVLFRDSSESVVLGPVQSEVINDSWKDKTASGLWQSDHGFVSASLKLKPLKHDTADGDDDDDDDDHDDD